MNQPPGRKPHAEAGSDVRDATRQRVITALRRGPRTLEQLVGELGLTRTAIRLHLTTLERDGVKDLRYISAKIRSGVG